MAKFVMKCPTCAQGGTDVYVSVDGGLFNSGLFAKKIVQCPHGHDINVKTDRMAVKTCPHCGNSVVYDQSKGESATCPVCQTKLNTLSDKMATVQIKCPQCGCEHTVAKDAADLECAVCGCKVDVQREIGKKKMREANAVSLIRYEGDNNTFVWKHPIEDFKLGSQLIVHDSQEALFFCGGEALDLFKGGTYTLTTENIPLLSAVYEVPSGEGTFHSEVYFINKTVHTGIKWGTSSRINMFDPVSGMHINIGAFGQYAMQVSDSKKLILKLVGTSDVFAHDYGKESKGTFDYIRSLIVSKVRTHFATVIKDKSWSILEIDGYLEELALGIKDKINPELEEYGLRMPEFFILNISTPEDSDDPKERENYKRMKQQFADRYLNVREEENKEAIALAAQKRRLVEAETEAKIRMMEAQVKAEGIRQEGFATADVQRAQGFTGRDIMQFDVQKAFAENIGNIGGGGSGIGDLIGLGAGLGMIGKVSQQVGNMMDGVMPESAPAAPAPAANPAEWTCSCGAEHQVGKFCNECGSAKPAPVETWDCPTCGNKGITGKFCGECGTKKPEPPAAWDCPTCGKKGITGKFCDECGTKKPEAPATWDCPDCGNKGIDAKFCPECGHKREE
ncbi:MAG: SPFH domain-containing protein [Firmicutes bacterium]|nr:SPFH domain-containing protein [Bacillota bacterium]